MVILNKFQDHVGTPTYLFLQYIDIFLVILIECNLNVLLKDVTTLYVFLTLEFLRTQCAEVIALAVIERFVEK